jgi:PEP-CTERM motif
MRRAMLLLSAILMAAPTAAQNFAGTTTFNDPAYNRPLPGSPPPELSIVGTAVHYQVLSFEVTVSGGYNILMTGIDPVLWDTFLGLHSDSFDPLAPLDNALIYNDDFPIVGQSSFSYDLMIGTPYFAILTGFDNDDVGAWTLEISGPGMAVPIGGAVPEPAAWAMLIGGFGVAGAAMRTRRRKPAFT